VSVLLHLNGAPGVGKSTIAQAIVSRRLGWLNCDMDVLRTLIGGWDDDFTGAGELIRPAARQMIAAHLSTGRGVVLPQLVMERRELAQFRRIAEDAGVRYVHVLLDAPDEELELRWQRRSDDRVWVSAAQEVLRGLGGTDAVLAAARLARKLAASDLAEYVRSEDHRMSAALAEVEKLLPPP
jgi:predicted kinase